MSSAFRRPAVMRGVAAALGLAVAALGLAAQPASAAADHLVVNEVYGGGGNSGATYTNDFVELYNPTGSAIDLSGYQVLTTRPPATLATPAP